VEARSNTSTVTLRVVRGVEMEVSNMVTSLTGLGLENDCVGEDQQQLYMTARPLVRESAPHQQTPNCLTVINIWS
jgi:hypothetical protein